MPGTRLQNRIAVIIGASSGLGRAIALAYANEGAKLVCSDLQPEPRKEIASKADQPPTHEVITSEGGEAIFVKCDVAQSKEIEALIEKAVKRFGRVDM